MPTNSQTIIIQGRAYVRLIEAARTLLELQPDSPDAALLHQVQATYKTRLRELVAMQPAHIVAEVLAASERIRGPVGDILSN